MYGIMCKSRVDSTLALHLLFILMWEIVPKLPDLSYTLLIHHRNQFMKL